MCSMDSAHSSSDTTTTTTTYVGVHHLREDFCDDSVLRGLCVDLLRRRRSYRGSGPPHLRTHLRRVISAKISATLSVFCQNRRQFNLHIQKP